MTWLPFDLHPEYPPQGIPRSRLNAHYGEAFHQRLEQTFAASDLVYNPPPEVVPNTMSALRVTELARERSLHEQVHDRLMRAYWEEARNIGDPVELLTLVVEAGLDEAQANGPRFLCPHVVADPVQALRHGCQRVEPRREGGARRSIRDALRGRQGTIPEGQRAQNQ